MKGDPEDLYELGEELRDLIRRYDGVLKYYPDINADLIVARQKVFARSSCARNTVGLKGEQGNEHSERNSSQRRND